MQHYKLLKYLNTTEENWLAMFYAFVVHDISGINGIRLMSIELVIRSVFESWCYGEWLHFNRVEHYIQNKKDGNNQEYKLSQCTGIYINIALSSLPTFAFIVNIIIKFQSHN